MKLEDVSQVREKYQDYTVWVLTNTVNNDDSVSLRGLHLHGSYCQESYPWKLSHVLHVCRFGCKGKNQVKLRTNVMFSMKLNLTPFLSSSVQNTSHSSYRLYAVVVSSCTYVFIENHLVTKSIKSSNNGRLPLIT